MSVPMDGTVLDLHVSNRSAQNPAVHFASARSTGATTDRLAPGACPAAAVASHPAAVSPTRTDGLMLPATGFRLRHAEGDHVLVRLDLERQPGRLELAVPPLHGRRLPGRQLTVAEGDRHYRRPVLARQGPVARLQPAQGERPVRLDVPLQG